MDEFATSSAALPFLSEDAQSFADAVRDLLEREHRLAELRDWPEGAERLEAVLVDFGIPGLLVRSEDGGLGLTSVELVALTVELGRSAVALPVVDGVLAGAIISGFGDDRSRTRWLAGLVTGRHRLGLSTPDNPYVVGSDRADAVVLEHSGAIYVAETGRCSFHPQASTDPRRDLASVVYDPQPDDLLSREPEARACLASLGALATAGHLTGLSSRMLVDAVGYARERHQFNRPIGSFQAIQHRLADTAVRVESAMVTCFRAAAEFAASPDHLVASVARAHCGEAARQVSIDALQVFGGIGFTEEHHLHYWLKRAKALEAAFGSTYRHREAVMSSAEFLR